MTLAKGTPKRYYKKPDDTLEPKKITILLQPKEIELLDILCTRYGANKSDVIRKGLEVLYMNSNSYVYWSTQQTVDASGANNHTNNHQQRKGSAAHEGQTHQTIKNIINCS